MRKLFPTFDLLLRAFKTHALRYLHSRKRERYYGNVDETNAAATIDYFFRCFFCFCFVVIARQSDDDFNARTTTKEEDPPNGEAVVCVGVDIATRRRRRRRQRGTSNRGCVFCELFRLRIKHRLENVLHEKEHTTETSAKREDTGLSIEL